MQSSNIVDKFEKIAVSLINSEYPNETPSENLIRKQLDAARLIYKVTNDEYDQVFRNVCARIRFTMDIGTVIIDKNTFRPWLDSRRADINFYYWERYQNYLLNEKGWNPRVVSTLNHITDNILDLLGDPKNDNPWQNRGLIMGDVQSGKTANYTALCNKAMDAGYKVVIILSGMQEILRRQTQERLDEELVGLDSERFLNKLDTKIVSKGVGRIDKNHFVATFTSKNNDFDQVLLNTLNLFIKNYSEPVLFVVKKQKTRLDYLERWLKTFNTEADGYIDMPALLIDDESDNGSINTRNDDENPTTINKSIRKLLKLFRRASYVGITATPYANIFINPESDSEMIGDDLFPRDFIYSLSPPSNYIGNNAIFGENPTHQNSIEIIEDAETIIPLSHPRDHTLSILPDSLYRAMCYFLLVNVVRDLRKDTTSHRSMLINISRFTIIHHRIAALVTEWLEKTKSDVLNYGMLPEIDAIKIHSIKLLRTVWEQSGINILTGCNWEKFQQEYLYRSIASIKVIEVNQSTGAASLDYAKYKDTGFRVIAIGGNSLSRGLTLEGLCVSYFYRNSKMYDTLLQMGRWFGYRDRYGDLCKIFMSEEARDCYTHITLATNELRDQIWVMNRDKMTPKEFGLMIRSSPENIETMVGKLIVTAPNKMKNASEIYHMVSVSNKLIETPSIPNNLTLLVNNFIAVRSFVSTINHECQYIGVDNNEIYHSGHPMWKDVPAIEVSTLIEQFSTDPSYFSFQARSIADYIKAADHLQFWDVVIPGGDALPIKLIENLQIKPELRSIDIKNSTLRINGPKLRVGSRSSTQFGLHLETIKNIDIEYKTQNKNTPDIGYLIKDRKPLLILHFIDIKSNGIKETNKVKDDLKQKGAMLVALGLGFPRFNDEDTKRIKYVINKIMQMQLTFPDMEETDDAD